MNASNGDVARFTAKFCLNQYLANIKKDNQTKQTDKYKKLNKKKQDHQIQQQHDTLIYSDDKQSWAFYYFIYYLFIIYLLALITL